MSESVCTYCRRRNPDGIERCQACGAPLPFMAAPETRVTIVEEPAAPARAAGESLSELLPSSEQLQEGLKAVGAVAGWPLLAPVLVGTAVGAGIGAATTPKH